MRVNDNRAIVAGALDAPMTVDSFAGGLKGRRSGTQEWIVSWIGSAVQAGSIKGRV